MIPYPLHVPHAVVCVLAHANNGAGTHFARGIVWSQRRHYDDIDYAIPETRYNDVEEAILDAVMYVAGHLTVVPDVEGKDHTVVIQTCNTRVHKLLTSVYLELIQVSPFPKTWPGVPAHHLRMLRCIHEMFAHMRSTRGTNVLYRLRSLPNLTPLRPFDPNFFDHTAGPPNLVPPPRFKCVTECALLKEIIDVVRTLEPLAALEGYEDQRAVVQQRLSWLAKAEMGTQASSDGHVLKGVTPTTAARASGRKAIAWDGQETRDVSTASSRRRPEVSTLVSQATFHPRGSVPSGPSQDRPVSEQPSRIAAPLPTISYYITPDGRQTAATLIMEQERERQRVRRPPAMNLKVDAKKSTRTKKTKITRSTEPVEETPHLDRSERTYKPQHETPHASSSFSQGAVELVPTPAVPIRTVFHRPVFAQFSHDTQTARLSAILASKEGVSGLDNVETGSRDEFNLDAREGARGHELVRGTKRKSADKDQTDSRVCTDPR